MAMLFENLNDGAFVVTRDENNELKAGFYHDVFDVNGDTMRIFEPIAPVDMLTNREILGYIQEAK